MDVTRLRNEVLEQIWHVVDQRAEVLSATVVGSFAFNPSEGSFSDIDTIVIVDQLSEKLFRLLLEQFAQQLQPVAAAHGFNLFINSTLGPLKFNDERTLVLHLMVYTVESHRSHVIKSPFTCLDWQRSPLWRKASLLKVYPVFGLQPRHFIHTRRGSAEYLQSLRDDTVSYREIGFPDGQYQEFQKQKPMGERGRHEFAYHVLHFLMQNFLKLVRRENAVDEDAELAETYFDVFPESREELLPFYEELRQRKHEQYFGNPVSGLLEKATLFVETFEKQFRYEFEDHAARFLFFRHAATESNKPSGDQKIFLGHSDVPICPVDEAEIMPLRQAFDEFNPTAVYASPLLRTRQSLDLLISGSSVALNVAQDPRLVEINYGQCEKKSVAEARRDFPEFFAALTNGEDPRFPGGGENCSDVHARILAFCNTLVDEDHQRVAVCTHNVVLRCLVGSLFHIDPSQWYRIRIPHLAPLRVVSSPRFGLFLELSEIVERELFADFLMKASGFPTVR